MSGRRPIEGSIPPPPPAPPPALPLVNLSHYAPRNTGTARPDGQFSATHCDADSDRGPFADDRRLIFDRLLAECGQDLVGQASSQQAIRFTAKPPADKSAGAWAAQNFDFENGELWLNNVAADVVLKNGKTYALVLDKFKGADGRARFRAGAIDDQIALLKKDNPSLTGAQIDCIADRFSKWNASPNFTHGATLSLSVPQIGVNGEARVQLGNTDFWMLADGRGVDYSSAPYGIDGARGRPLPPPGRPFQPALPGNIALMSANAIHGVAGFLLACFLVHGSIRIFFKRRARRSVASQVRMDQVGFGGAGTGPEHCFHSVDPHTRDRTNPNGDVEF